MFPSLVRADTTRTRVGAPCAIGFGQIAHQPPKLTALKKDLPEISNPIEYIAEFEARRTQWNQLNPENRNNFPMPEMKGGVSALMASLNKVKRPAENRVAAERFIKELKSLDERGFPYRESLLKMHEAMSIIALKHPMTTAQAKAAVKSGAPRIDREKFDIKIFDSEDHVGQRAEFEALMEKEIFFPTARDQSVDGLAENFLLGIRPIQITERANVTDGLNMTSLHRFGHDVAHAYTVHTDEFSRLISSLPLETRIRIAREIGDLPTVREQHLARFGIFRTLHEWGSESAIPFSPTADNIASVRAEYRKTMDREMTNAEAVWLQNWFRDHVGRRLYEAQAR